MDVKQKKVLGVLPDFDYFNGHGWHKNRGYLDVAWALDSRHAIAICGQRWDDSGILWIDPAARTFSKRQGPAGKRLAVCLPARPREEEMPEAGEMMFSNPAVLGPNVVVLDALSEIPKEEVDGTYDYHLKVRFTPGKDGAVQCQILAAHKDERGRASRCGWTTWM